MPSGEIHGHLEEAGARYYIIFRYLINSYHHYITLYGHIPYMDIGVILLKSNIGDPSGCLVSANDDAYGRVICLSRLGLCFLGVAPF